MINHGEQLQPLLIATKQVLFATTFNEIEFVLPNRDKKKWQLEILHEDDDLIAVNKPAGLPSQVTLDRNRANLASIIREYLGVSTSLSAKTINPTRADQSGAASNSIAYLGEHHRLDRDTSGVIVFTKSKKANQGLADQFQNHAILKKYIALTPSRSGRSNDLNLSPNSSWQISNHLEENRLDKKVVVVHSGGKQAKTDFLLREKAPSACCIEAQPLTGRRHQIRVHLAESGLPIFGDQLYGSSINTERIMLHALHLELYHPVSKHRMVLSAPIPDDFSRTAHSFDLQLHFLHVQK